MEVSAYIRQEIVGGVIIRYLVRQAGDREWQPVKLFRHAEPEQPRHRDALRDTVMLANR